MARDPSPLIKQAEQNYLPRATPTTRPEDVANENVTICEKCGAELRVGMYPFCKGDPAAHGYGAPLDVSDDIPGGISIEHGLCNLDGSPRTYYSHSEIRAEAARRGLRNVVTHRPKPGSDRSPHTTRWI